MCHHLETSRTDCIYDLGTFIEVGDFEFLLKEDARLLVGRSDNAFHEDVVWRRRGWMEQREEVDGLWKERMLAWMNMRFHDG